MDNDHSIPPDKILSDEQKRVFEALKVISEYNAKNKTQSSVVSHRVPVEREVPLGYSPFYPVPYFNRKCAEELRPHLDKLFSIDDSGKLLFNYDEEIFFSNTNFNNLKTGRLKIQHSWLYLIERLDPDKVYRKLRDAMEIRKEPGGLVLRWKKNLTAARLSMSHTLKTTPLVGHNVEVLQKKNAKWKGDLTRFLMDVNQDGNMFKKTRIILDDEDKQWIVELIKDAGSDFHLLSLEDTSFTVVFSSLLKKNQL